MKIFNKRIVIYDIIYIATYILVGILVILKGAVYYPDSFTFIDMALNHSPGYCTFLKILTSIFGDYFESPLIVIQYFIIVFGINFFVKTLKKIFDLHYIGFIILQLICLAPCLYVHNLGSAILSEALTYPIFLVVFALTLKMFVEENLKSLYKISVLLFVLILTRGQFLSLIPILFLIVTYIIFKKKSFARHFYFFFILALIPILTSLSEKTYNKLVFGYFVNNSMNYVHLISSPFFISNQSDESLFFDEDEKTYFKLIYNSLKEAELTRQQNLTTDDYLFYQKNFPQICNRRIYDLGLNFFKSKGLNYIEQNLELNKLCSRMVFSLIKNNFKTWITLFIKNLTNSFGSSKQMLFFFMLFFFGVFNLIKSNKNIYKFIVLATLFMFANNMLIALVVHSIKRYIFYFDWIIFAIFIIIISEIFKKKTNEC